MNSQTHCSTCRKHLGNQGVWCLKCGWVHLKCSGLNLKTITPQHLSVKLVHKDQQQQIKSPTTADEITPTQREEPNNANFLPQTSNDLTSPAEPRASDFWANLTDETFQTLTNLYNEAAHWKPRFFTVSKNKTGHLFVETLSVIFNQVAMGGPNAKVALTAAMSMPHQTLARTKTDIDTSNNKTITWRPNSWLQGDIKSLFSEAKALQTRLPKGRAKTRDEFRKFDSHMSSGKTSKALRCLDDQQKGNVLSVTDRIEGETVLNEKHPKPEAAPDAYRLTEADDNTLPFHSSVFDRITPAAVRKAALRTNGCRWLSGLEATE